MQPRLCRVALCTRSYVSKGLCSKHYSRWSRKRFPLYGPASGCAINGCDMQGPLDGGYCIMHGAPQYEPVELTSLCPPSRPPPAMTATIALTEFCRADLDAFASRLGLTLDEAATRVIDEWAKQRAYDAIRHGEAVHRGHVAAWERHYNPTEGD